MKEDKMQIRPRRWIFALVCLLIAGLACVPLSGVRPEIVTPRSGPQPTATAKPVSSPTPPEVAGAATQADIIFHNARVITMDESQPRGEAIAVAGDLIQAVGTDEEVLAFAGDDTWVVDLEGRAVLPGFIESHAHWFGDREMGGLSDPNEVVQILLAQGYTSVNELFVNQERLDELIALDQAGRLTVRVNAYLPINYRQDRYGDWYLEYPMGSRPSPNVRIAGVKIFMDHGWGGQSDFNWTVEELHAEIMKAHRAGYQIAVHTVQSEAHTIVLDGLIGAMEADPNQPGRHRIEHVVALSDEDLARMADLGIIASVQLNGPSIWAQDPTFQQEVLEELQPIYARWRDLLEAGVTMVGSSDWPWLAEPAVADPQPGSPLLLLYQAQTRALNDLSAPPSWMLDQAIDLEQALPMLTINSAYATFEERLKGSLTPGKWADMVILSDDPLAVPIDEVPFIEVQATFIGGSLTYCAQGQQRVCPGAGDAQPPTAVGALVEYEPDELVRLAVMGPESGVGASVFNAIEVGAQVAIEEHGEIKGHAVELIRFSSSCTREGGRLAATKVQSAADVAGVIGPTCSTEGYGALPILEAGWIATVSPSATLPDVSSYGPTVFHRVILHQGQPGSQEGREADSLSKVQDFYDQLQERENEELEADVRFFAAYGHDAARVLLEAIEAASIADESGRLTLHRQLLLEELDDPGGFQGLTGEIRFLESGDRAVGE